MLQARGVINHQVAVQDIDENHLQDPSRYLGQLAKQEGVEGRCVGLMTAVDMRCLILKRAEDNGFWVEGFFTVGIENAVRAGEPTSQELWYDSVRQVGTINIILLTNAQLSRAAMVSAIGVATESKTATLMDEGILNASGKQVATGTGTDVVAVVSGDGPYCRYSGTHTKIGELIGRVVSDGVMEGLKKDKAWSMRM